MGGLPKYQQAFLSGDESTYPEESVSKLRSLIQEQLNVTALALKMHGRLVPASMVPLQERLVTKFNELEGVMHGKAAGGGGVGGGVEFAPGSSSTLKSKSFSIGPPGMMDVSSGGGTQPRGHPAARRARSEASDRKADRKPSIVK
jgi:hypothetical protein